MIGSLVSRIIIMTFGNLYPAYCSFKTVGADTSDQNLTWIMYWIAFGIFTVLEAFTDILLVWLPLYYESKILLLIWLLPSVGNGSAIIYRMLLDPILRSREEQLDQMLLQFTVRGKQMLFYYVALAGMYVIRIVMEIGHKFMPNTMLFKKLNHLQSIKDIPTRDHDQTSVEIKTEEEIDPLTDSDADGDGDMDEVPSKLNIPHLRQRKSITDMNSD